jgi:hypothetical protein
MKLISKYMKAEKSVGKWPAFRNPLFMIDPMTEGAFKAPG